MNLQGKSWVAGIALIAVSQSTASSNNPASTSYVDNAINAATVTAGNGLSKSNNVISVNPFYTVGQAAQGGVVFFVDATGQHGLVIALSDTSSTYPWGTASAVNQLPTEATLYGLGNGYINTVLIIAREASQYTATSTVNYAYAAFQATTVAAAAGEAACDTVSCVGGWYLPNQSELILAGQTLCGLSISGYTPLSFSTYYWTSKQGTTVPSNAVAVEFSDNASCTGTPSFQTTTNFFNVRAIRQF